MFLIIAFGLCLREAAAQFNDPYNFKFRSYTVKDGLVHNFVRKCQSNSKGFLWLITQNGLSRFDGFRFQNFQNIAGDTTSLPYNDLTDIVIDKQDRIWLAYQSGICFYDPRKGCFSKLTHALTLVKMQGICYDVVADKLWAASFDGLLSINPSTLETAESSLKGSSIGIYLCMISLPALAQNVGIGKTNPAAKLDIGNGRLRFSGQVATNTASGIEFTDATGTNLNGFVGTLNDSMQGFYGFLGSGWTFLHNNKNGNIGLQGNSNPRAPLSFANATCNKISLYGDANAAHYGLGIQGFQMQFYTDASNADHVFGYGSSASFTETMRIKGNGRVGIGIPNPSEQLQVQDGNIKVGDVLWSSSTNDRVIKFGDGEFVSVGEASADDRMRLTANRFHFTRSTGLDTYVGINNAMPTYNLDIDGSLRITGVGIIGSTLNVAGNTTLNGTLKVVGGSPRTGKVLTSDASGNASWKTQAYNNQDRFMLKYITGAVVGNPYSVTYTSSNIIINTASGEVTINKTGLYHFEVSNTIFSSTGDFTQTSTSAKLNEISITIGSRNYNLGIAPFFREDNGGISGSRSFAKETIDMYITAGTIAKINASSASLGSGEAILSGYLIAE